MVLQGFGAMKTKNQTEPTTVQIVALDAANEDGISPSIEETSPLPRPQAWSPREVWRTRVKVALLRPQGESNPNA
jgi:hypothetical protein